MGSIKKAVKKVFGGSSNQTYKEPTPAAEIGFVEADTTDTTEEESEKEQLASGKKKGKKGLKISTSGGTGRNIV